MKSIRIAIYVSILIHFLRLTRRKLSQDRPRKIPGKSSGKPQGHPVQVGVGITHTIANPGPHGLAYEYVRVATCIDLDTASALVNTLNGMTPGYGHRFSLINPDKEINRYQLEVLKSDRIHLLRENYRNCPDPERLAKTMQTAAIYVLLHGLYR